MGFKINMKDETVESADRRQGFAAGWFHAIVFDCYEDSKTGRQVFEFKAKDGTNCMLETVTVSPPNAKGKTKAVVTRKLTNSAAFKGATLFERLGNPAMETDHAEVAMRRAKLF